MGDVKARLDFISCIFEFEGDSDFVKSELDKLREMINDKVLPLNACDYDEADDGNGIDEENNNEVDSSVDENLTIDISTLNKTKAKPQTRSKPTTPNLLDSIKNIRGNANDSLETFLKTVKHNGNSNKYIVIAYWLKHKHKEPINEICQDHIYTCYRILKWQPLSDYKQPFSNAKSKHTAFRNGSQKSYFILTDEGDFRVESELTINE